MADTPEFQEVTCILCPNACQLGVHYYKDKKEITEVENLRCKRGQEYAEQEVFDPRRSVMSVVPINSKKWKVTSVLTSAPVPKRMIFDVYNEIKKLRLSVPVKRGDVAIKGVCGTESDVIITRTVPE